MKRVAFVLSAWLPIAVAALVLAAPPDAGVTVQVFKFRPDRIDVKAGTRVTWTNQDEITHTVTSGTPEKRDATFDIRLAGKGTTAASSSRAPASSPSSASGIPRCAARSTSTNERGDHP